MQHGRDLEALLAAQIVGEQLPVVPQEDTIERGVGAFNQSRHCFLLTREKRCRSLLITQEKSYNGLSKDERLGLDPAPAARKDVAEVRVSSNPRLDTNAKQRGGGPGRVADVARILESSRPH